MEEPASGTADSTAAKAPAASPAAFSPTRWTLVQRARGETPEARTALGELCEAYYQPVLRFLCREGREEDAARELTQEFFARVLGRGGFDEAAPGRGRFRSYLLGALKHFLADENKHSNRLKRGGGVITESLDAALDETSPHHQVAEPSTAPPDASFDREWALAVIARGVAVVEREWSTSGRSEAFDTLKPWLMGEGPSQSQADAAGRLGLSEGAVKVAIHRLRKRFREAIRTEISQTLRDPAPGQVDEELRHLVAALS